MSDKMKTTPTDLLASILNCGTADIEFICELLDSFNVDFSDIQFEECKTANFVIGEIFSIVANRHDIPEEMYNYYTNCLDSHFYIDGEKMYSEQDVINWKETAENINKD